MLNENKIFEKSVVGFSKIFSLGLASKFLTFLLNVAIVREIHPQAKGVAYMWAGLVNSALFLQREALRVYVARHKSLNNTPDPQKSYGQLINLGWLGIPWGLFMLVIATVIVWGSVGEEYQSIPLYKAYFVYAFAIVLEMMAEPLFLLAQNLLKFQLRIVAEGLALVFQSVVLYFLLKSWILEPGSNTPEVISAVATVFGWAQVAHSLTLVIVYYGYWLRKGRYEPELKLIITHWWKLGPHAPTPTSNFLNWEGIKMSVTLWVESIFRWVLTEGERIVLVSLTLLADQGAYEVVSNLGSLVARLFFKQIEEIALTTWSKLLSGTGEKRNKDSPPPPTQAALTLSCSLYILLLQLLGTVGAVFLLWGCAYSPTLLVILYGRRWAETKAPLYLTCYCVYTCLMGISGTCEAFVRATAGIQNLRYLQGFQLLCGLGYLAAMYYFNSLAGITGIIAANCLSMVVRITFCLFWYSNQYFHMYSGTKWGFGTIVRGINVKIYLYMMACGVLNAIVVLQLPVIVYARQKHRQEPIMHIHMMHACIHLLVGGITFVGLGAMFWKFNKEWCRHLKRLWKGQTVEYLIE